MSEHSWLEFLHKSVMADERNEVLLLNRGQGLLAVRISHRADERTHHEHVYTPEQQRDPDAMAHGVMAQAKALNRAIKNGRSAA